MFTDLIFYVYFVKHQVRILGFDNYQRCSVPLIQTHMPSVCVFDLHANLKVGGLE